MDGLSAPSHGGALRPTLHQSKLTLTQREINPHRAGW